MEEGRREWTRIQLTATSSCQGPKPGISSPKKWTLPVSVILAQCPCETAPWECMGLILRLSRIQEESGIQKAQNKTMIYKTLKARQKVKDLAQVSIFYSRKQTQGGSTNCLKCTANCRQYQDSWLPTKDTFIPMPKCSLEKLPVVQELLDKTRKLGGKFN